MPPAHPTAVRSAKVKGGNGIGLGVTDLLRRTEEEALLEAEGAVAAELARGEVPHQQLLNLQRRPTRKRE